MAIIEELKKRSPHGSVPPFYVAIIHLGMSDRAIALDSLEEAYTARSPFMGMLKMDRIFDPLRSEPRRSTRTSISMGACQLGSSLGSAHYVERII
jgi:hypothetical protein